MGSQRLWATLVAVLVLSAVGPRSPGVWAQEASCPPSYDWNQNSLGQNPCVVCSTLEASCRSEGSYTIPPLNSTENYVPPLSSTSGDIQCECNTVIYSLYQACTSCQGAVILSWTSWISQCPYVYVSELPYNVPPGTDVPRWAFINVTSLPNETYSDAVAMSVGRDPEATPNGISTLNARSSTRPSTLPASSPTQTDDTPSDSNAKNNIGAIVGGVVGSVVPLIVLSVIVALVLHRRRQNGVPPQIQQTPNYYVGQSASPVLTNASTNPRHAAYPNVYGPPGYAGAPEI